MPAVLQRQITMAAPIYTSLAVVTQDVRRRCRCSSLTLLGQHLPAERDHDLCLPGGCVRGRGGLADLAGTGDDLNSGSTDELACPVDNVDANNVSWTGSCTYWVRCRSPSRH